MEAEGGGNGSSLEAPPWAVRIRRGDGTIAGTGILLSPDRVLTCARVVADGEPVTAEFAGARGSGTPRVRARVLAAGRGGDDPGGAVALLDLDRPRPAGEDTALHRLSAPGRRVRLFGFPGAYGAGDWLPAVVDGSGPAGELRLVPLTQNPPAGEPGFTGAGVVDDDTGEVIGIVLPARPGDDGRPLMSPAETIVRHLPDAAAWIRGRAAVDETLRPPDGQDATGGSPFDTTYATRLARWFRDSARVSGGDAEAAGHVRSPESEERHQRNLENLRARIKISLVRHEERARDAAMRRAIRLADRESRTPASVDRASLDPPDTVPSPGGLDLAVAAAGRGTDLIAERIAERIGRRQPPGVPAAERIRSGPVNLTLVVVGVDEAAEPESLLDLLGDLAERGSRLLLVFRGNGPHYERAQRELLIGPAQRRLAALTGKLAEITGPLADALAEHTREVRADTEPAARTLMRARHLETELAGARGVLLGLGQDQEDLDRCEARAERWLTRMRETVAALSTLRQRHAVLAGRLSSYHALHRDTTDREDLTAETLYVTAHRLLHTRPCDVGAAESAVRAYTDRVEQATTRDAAGVHEATGVPDPHPRADAAPVRGARPVTDDADVPPAVDAAAPVRGARPVTDDADVPPAADATPPVRGARPVTDDADVPPGPPPRTPADRRAPGTPPKGGTPPR